MCRNGMETEEKERLLYKEMGREEKKSVINGDGRVEVKGVEKKKTKKKH